MSNKAANNVKNNVRVDEREYDDSTRAREAFIINMHKIAQLHDLELTDDHLATAHIQNSDDAVQVLS